MDVNHDLLKMELAELNTFVRHHFQLYLGWYTFFLTVNFGAIGWFTSDLLAGNLKVSLPVIFVATFFVIQLALSYLGSLELRNYFLSCGNRSIELLDLLVAQPQDSPCRPRTAIPLLVYHRIIGLICWTLVSFVFFWIALTIVSVYLVPL